MATYNIIREMQGQKDTIATSTRKAYIEKDFRRRYNLALNSDKQPNGTPSTTILHNEGYFERIIFATWNPEISIKYYITKE